MITGQHCRATKKAETLLPGNIARQQRGRQYRQAKKAGNKKAGNKEARQPKVQKTALPCKKGQKT